VSLPRANVGLGSQATEPSGRRRVPMSAISSTATKQRNVAKGQKRTSIATRARLGRELIEQRFGLFQIKRVEPFSEPVIERSEESSGFGAHA
jgi:hypothetical protein